jgi:hypothetical protein
VTYITGRNNEINALKPSAGTRYVSSSTRKTSWNGVDINNPERSFKPEEWDRLRQDGQTLVNKYRNEIRNPPRQGGGRGHAAEVATDPAAVVVVEEAEETTNVFFKRLTPIMTITNLPRQNLEEALAQPRALREVKLVSSLNS